MLGHLLIVDDDTGIRTLLAKYLNESGYTISTANSVKECEALLKEFIFDLIILDVMMPNETGISFIQRAKSTLITPVIMLSALGNIDDRIDGLKSGADDYLAKPFEPEELLLRIQNLLKRTTQPIKNEYIFGDYVYQADTGNLSKSGEFIHLTQTEKNLLNEFTKNSGIIISRENILKDLSESNERTIDTQIARLRNKIESDPKRPIHLQTIRGSGYVLWAKPVIQ